MNIKEVTFDEDDKNLFIIDDLKLKADAIRYSILPKLELLVNHCISEIRTIYGVNPLDYSSITKSPSFRAKRTKDFKINYQWAKAGINGQRKKGFWKGVSIQENKEISILPFEIEFHLTTEGLMLILHSNYARIHLKDNTKFIDFHVLYQEEIERICHLSWTHFRRGYINESLTYFMPLKDYLIEIEKLNIFEIIIFSRPLRFPISSIDIEEFVESFIILYPIYDSYIQISLGQEIRFKEQLILLEKWLLNYVQTINPEKPKIVGIANIERAKELADSKVKVMPAIRWQVFQRDNWKCVACGRTAEDGIILHIDHIIPRSKGGQDIFENYQTLCNICNIGKSNKDQTDLRKLSLRAER